MRRVKYPVKFNKAMIQFFWRADLLGVGAQTFSTLFRAESTVLLYFHFLSGKPLMMKDVPMAESTGHRAKNRLLKAGLIKRIGKTRLKRSGPETEIYRLVTR